MAEARPGEYNQFEIAGEMELLPAAMAVAMGSHVGPRLVKAWSLDQDGKRLLLHWIITKDNYPTLGTWDVKTAISTVQSWLESVDYGVAPDTDGSTDRGFHIYNDRWGHIGDDRTAFIAVEPHWVVYGK